VLTKKAPQIQDFWQKVKEVISRKLLIVKEVKKIIQGLHHHGGLSHISSANHSAA